MCMFCASPGFRRSILLQTFLCGVTILLDRKKEHILPFFCTMPDVLRKLNNNHSKHSAEIMEIFSHFFGKNFVKATFFTKEVAQSGYDDFL